MGLKLLGIKKGDEVITPPNSFVASTASISHVGATPVFADVLDDQNINPDEIKKKITKKTKAIMPVHLTGRICEMNEIKYISKEIDEQLEINSHYKGYLKKQKADILAFKRDENLIIPKNLNYDNFAGLSNEVKSKFKKIRPKTMGQALRIDGITPAAVYILLSHLKRKSIKHIA